MPEVNLAEFEAFDEVAELRRVNADLQRRLKQAKAKNEEMVAATFAGVRDALLSLGPVKPVPAPKVHKAKGKPEVALWHLTDWQGSKTTTSYNSVVMRGRVMRFCEKAAHITEIQRAHHPVKRGVLLLGGDMGEGLFNYPTQPFEIDATIFEQYTYVARLIVDTIRRALALYDEVLVVTEWGNHGRIGSKRAAVPRSDNFDRMTYELAKAMLLDEPRVSWQGSEEDVQRVEVGNYRALLIHGDEFGRNGFVSPSTMVSKIAQWQSGAYPWEFRDCYSGHLHNHAEYSLPNGLGAVYQTGSPESDNRYAGISMAASATPSQRLHFVDPAKGRVTAQFKVLLDS
jgi:hypothetical protein